ncbi:hypothetical protein [Myxosarcina sp. GI1(2024)]
MTLAKKLDKDSQAALVKELMEIQEMSISFGGCNISTAEVLVYIQNTDTNDIANVVDALAERIKGKSGDLNSR